MKLSLLQLSESNKILRNFSIQKWSCILLISIISLILSAKGITRESTVSPNGAMPRYMMNGVFFHDLMRDWPLSNITQYAFQYFARYPALTLKHHPLLPGVALVPFYAILECDTALGKEAGSGNSP
ncbi:MAG: hypothetical protein JSV61_10245 [Anaerolineales bacterium]|nr:MAG: hypothetical protein JSV61_10245 [Anaerolineales bacterium]